MGKKYGVGHLEASLYLAEQSNIEYEWKNIDSIFLSSSSSTKQLEYKDPI